MHGKRLYLLDATAFCYRAFYAVKGLATSSGEPTGAVYGFLNILNKIFKKFSPEFMAACFDVSRDTFRSRKFAQYKMNRPKMSEELSGQIPLIKEIILAYGIRIVEKEGLEADDIIACLALRSASKLPVTIISSDKDILQLVCRDIEVFNPYKEGGIIYDENRIIEEFGVKPFQIADVLSLMGDSADNIPGIPGIGEKTALNLIREFGSVEKIITGLDSIKKDKIRFSIGENKEKIKLNKELVMLRNDFDIDIDFEDLMIKPPDTGKLAVLFKRLEFNKFLLGLKVESACQEDKEDDFCDAGDLDGLARDEKDITIYLEGFGKLYIYCKGKYFCLDDFSPAISRLLSDPEIRKTGHNLKSVKTILAKRGIVLNGLYFDIMVAGYLLNPSQPSFDAEGLALKYLDRITPKGLSGQGYLNLITELKVVLEKELKEKKLFDLFEATEMPLTGVLAEMELVGISLDSKLLLRLSKEVRKKTAALEKKIYALSGSKFNINSPKQLRVILFDKLMLPVVKKTKTGPSTDEEVLNKLSARHELPALLLDYRQLVKLKTTYIDVLPRIVDLSTGKVHTIFNQCATETGRLSSSNPNLQNIPVKTDIGSRIREAIIPSGKGRLFLSCDYSQIELRILAHLSGDKGLIRAFKEKGDIHKATASIIYSVKEAEVTEGMRDCAKRVNFGIIYGLTSFGLSRDLNIPVDEAQAFIDAYFMRYPGVKEYIEDQIDRAERDGFVTTILGRRRYVPEIRSKNISIRQFAQRQAVNTPIQGSASDLIKLAMVSIHSEIQEKGLDSKMVLQIHDELLFDVPDGELFALANLAKKNMENVLSLSIPIVVDMKKGLNWLAMSVYPETNLYTSRRNLS